MVYVDTSSPLGTSVQDTTTMSSAVTSADSTQSVPSPSMSGEPSNTTTSIMAIFNDSLPFDAVTQSLESSISGGGETSLEMSSGVPLYSSSSVFKVSTDPFSGSGEGNVTSSDVPLPDSSWAVSGEGEVINTTTLWDDSVSSVMPTTSDGAGEVSLWDILIIALPVGLTLLIVIIIIIVLCVVCCRRKKKSKEQEVKMDQEDLWVDPDSQLVPMVPVTLLSATDSEPSTVVSPDGHTAASAPAESQQVCTVIYDFPGQQESQLTLTPGDVILVQEKAEHGWWRGVVKGDNTRTGWFPSSFVAPGNLIEDGGKTTSPESPTSSTAGAGGGGPRPSTSSEEAAQPPPEPRPRITSFLIRKKPTKRPPQLANIPSLTQIHNQNSVNKASRPTTPVKPISPVKVIASSLCAEDFSNSVKDKFYKALFSYKAAYRGEVSLREGELILGKERDRNGWMLGKKVTSGEQGWFPAVYVDEVSGDIPTTTQESQGPADMTSPQQNRDVYSLLAVNRNKSPDQSWVAIEHRVIQDFTGQGEAQMSVREGDVVAVVQALDNGWWLGCHGDRLGWFPADYVQLLEEKSEGKLDSFSLLPLCRDPHDTQRARHINNDNLSYSSLDTRDHHDRPLSHNISQDSILSDGEKPKPSRRAPKPPLAASRQLQGSLGNISVSSTHSVNPRPARPAPAPPSNKSRTASVGSMDRLESQPGTPTEGHVVAHKNPVKPRVVRIPKEKLGLDKLSSWPAPVPTSPGVSSCGSPQVLQAPASVNSFFVTSDNQGQSVTPENQEKSVMLESRIQAKENVPLTQSTQTITEDLPNDKNDPNQPSSDLLERNEAKSSDRQPSPDSTKDTANSKISKPQAASIAVQTDIPEPDDNNDVTKDVTHSALESGVGVQTSVSVGTNITTGRVSEVRSSEERGVGTTSQDFVAPVEKGKPNTNSDNKNSVNGSSRNLTRQNAETADYTNQDDEVNNARSSPESEATGDNLGDLEVDGKDPPIPHPKPQSPLPDLLKGAKSTPEEKNPIQTTSVQPQTKDKVSKDRRPSNTDPDNPMKPVKLNPLVRPLSQKEEDEEAGLMIPPEGVSGRVSMIVHQINRMASVEEKLSPTRKNSPPFSSLEQTGEAGPQESEPPERSVSPSSRHRQRASEYPIQPAMNGDAESVPTAGEDRVQPNGVSNPHTFPTEPAEPIQARQSRARSQGDGQPRRPSSKRSRVAPPPPKSPPPSLNRKQRLTMSREQSTEC